MDTIKIRKGEVRMVAHRGVSGLETENSCAAFVAAGNRSYFGIETDVHRTCDGQLVCIHDGNTGRVAENDLAVEKSTLSDLRALVLKDMDGSKGRFDLRIPTLKEYVRICKKYRKICVLELKSDFTQEEIGQIVDVFRAESYLCGVIFISFVLDNLLLVKKLLPKQVCQFLVEEYTDDLVALLVQHGLDLDINLHALTREGLEKLHENNIRVNVWTVDDPKDAERLVSWGVDYITSNILE